MGWEEVRRRPGESRGESQEESGEKEIVEY